MINSPSFYFLLSVFIPFFLIPLILFFMKFSGNNQSHLLLIIMVVLITLSALLCIILPYQENSLLHWLRIISGSVFILFLPGYLLTEVFFEKNEIDILEKTALSFALSVSVIPLLVFYSNLLGMQISALNVYAITFLTIFSLTVYILFFQKLFPRIHQK